MSKSIAELRAELKAIEQLVRAADSEIPALKFGRAGGAEYGRQLSAKLISQRGDWKTCAYTYVQVNADGKEGAVKSCLVKYQRVSEKHAERSQAKGGKRVAGEWVVASRFNFGSPKSIAAAFEALVALQPAVESEPTA